MMSRGVEIEWETEICLKVRVTARYIRGELYLDRALPIYEDGRRDKHAPDVLAYVYGADADEMEREGMDRGQYASDEQAESYAEALYEWQRDHGVGR